MSQITTQLTHVTPEMASSMLCHNIGNREVREGNIQKYVKILKAGEWKITHQGIAFDTDGNLIDGQHRLMAIVRSKIGADIMVTRGLEPDAAMVMDQGARRNAADILKESPKVAEVINLAARLLFGETVPSPAQLQKVRPGIKPYAEKVLRAYGGNATFFSSASLKLAAIARIHYDKDEDYILDMYANLCRGNLDDLPPVGNALVRAHLKGRTNATNKSETMALGLYVFDRRRKDSKNMRLEVEAAPDIVRAAVRAICNL